jgi:hypothetical protein
MAQCPKHGTIPKTRDMALTRKTGQCVFSAFIDGPRRAHSITRVRTAADKKKGAAKPLSELKRVRLADQIADEAKAANDENEDKGE